MPKYGEVVKVSGGAEYGQGRVQGSEKKNGIVSVSVKFENQRVLSFPAAQLIQVR